MKILLDTSTIDTRHSGTGVYTAGVFRTLVTSPSLSEVVTLGGDHRTLTKIAKDTNQPTDCLPNIHRTNGKRLTGSRSQKKHQTENSHTESRRPKHSHFFVPHNNWHRLIQFDLSGNRDNHAVDAAIFPNFFAPSHLPFPVYTTIHDLSFFTHPQYYNRKMVLWYRWFVQKSVNRSDIILTVSNTSAEQIGHYLHVPDRKIRVIRPGYSLPDHANLVTDNYGVRQLPGNAKITDAYEPYVLYAGNIEPKKNVIAMIRGFLASGIRHHLIIAGKITDRETGREFRSLVKANDTITYVGYPDDAYLAVLLKYADGHVNLSHVEGFGLALLEAFRFNVPSLISRDPAMAETAQSHSVRVSSDDKDEIIEGFRALSYFEKDDGFYSHCRHIRSTYTWERFGKELLPELHPDSAVPERIRLLSRNGHLSSLEHSIIKALTYSAVFRAPLEKKRLHAELPYFKCTSEECYSAWNQLLERFPEIFFEADGYCGINGYSCSPEQIRRSKKENRDFVAEHYHLLHRLERMPWCVGLFLSGGTVHGSRLNNRDIDLFVVADENRVWLLYTLIRLFSLIKRQGSRLCTNYLVDMPALDIQWQQDFYTAHQLVNLIPVDGELQDFHPLNVNIWIRAIFKNLPVRDKRIPKSQNQGSRILEWVNLALMGTWTRWWKRLGRQNRTGGMLWDAHRIKLHTNDHRPMVYKKWSEMVVTIEKKIQDSMYEHTED